MSAISAASSPYSSRSCPSSDVGYFWFARRNSAITASGDCISVLLKKVRGRKPRFRPRVRELRRVSELRSDRAEDRLDAGAGRLHGADRDERDERDEQRVLEQVLAFVVARERFHGIHELHDILPFRVLHRFQCGAFLRRRRVSVLNARLTTPRRAQANGNSYATGHRAHTPSSRKCADVWPLAARTDRRRHTWARQPHTRLQWSL